MPFRIRFGTRPRNDDDQGDVQWQATRVTGADDEPPQTTTRHGRLRNRRSETTWREVTGDRVVRSLAMAVAALFVLVMLGLWLLMAV